MDQNAVDKFWTYVSQYVKILHRCIKTNIHQILCNLSTFNRETKTYMFEDILKDLLHLFTFECSVCFS